MGEEGGKKRGKVRKRREEGGSCWRLLGNGWGRCWRKVSEGKEEERRGKLAIVRDGGAAAVG